MFELTDIFDVLLLRQYNTRLVVICTMLLGCACGLMGGFLLLRKRSLMGDTLSHATLPGVCLAFFVGVMMGGQGKSLPLLLLGATVTGVLGCGTVLFIRNRSRIKDDAAMGIVLSVFFGAGVALLTMVTKMPEGAAAGLESFIYGKTASMVLSDFKLLSVVTGSVLLLSGLLFKEFRLLCFDESYAASQGWPVKFLDVLLIALVTAVTVAGLQAVGLILIIAFLITPAAAARFWTDRLDRMLLLSALIGGVSGWMGASVSALIPNMPAGAVIVLVAAAFFLFSMLFGGERGVVVRWVRQLNLKRSVGRQHLLRALYEILEADDTSLRIRAVPFRQVRGRRTWTDGQLRRTLGQAYNDGLLDAVGKDDSITLTEAGLEAAAKVTRNHRLWELYLIEYADVATSRVDRDADAVEHVLGEKLVALLEAKLVKRHPASDLNVPASPHPITPGD
ncbi:MULTISPECIES: iron chelate uptake ABC transporter family permease subunit [unclassified Lentimonas]|uniref:metal ABC transporter permease n=1 Tax=unclassified Lentimonas TaxID=2630993 RepID=UPI00132A5B13|nr:MULTISPECIES: iron chelate uptake ABC transporter family permease subunit [unclassified Lentimonas]CAA6691230.1 Manganese ABC transporter, inner membrane permease protein SitC [Lentimonas sp. CC19]CAA6694822.1 Manganese ABC transporter, inner membrane permease protein SitC [Lentimonas sp. CC10]CAA7071608.1 Manganese ABC transporter, inner membrane permease protein SitC [Lentimonas sp. CC11]